MPPPHFSTNIGGPSQHSQQSASAPSLSDLPKQLRAQVKDSLQYIQAALTIEDEITLQSASLKAFQAIQRLVDSSDLQQDRENESNKGALPRSRVLSGEAATSIAGTPGEGSQIQLGKLVSTLITTSLFNLFSDDMDQDSHSKRQLLISFLHALRPILDPRCVVLEWWDVLLRPMLKNPHCNVSVSRKAQRLVIWAMSTTPSSAYEDDPAPSAVWPPPDQSSLVASWRSERKPGDAPYPASSTRSASQTRSSEDGDARFSALYSTPQKKGGPPDPMRRFTQRIFDLYTSEASSASTKSIEEDEARDFEDDEREDEEIGEKSKPGFKDKVATDLDLVGPTWKGNLEAIILTFGEERPKPFFHHLSESFVDPHARIPILLLLTIFFRLSSLYAYHVVSTPFVRLLVLSLQLDTSKTCTSLGVLALVTLVPHFPNWLANGGAGGLPALLSIFARIVDWRRVLPGWEDKSNVLDGSEVDKEEEEWAKVEHLSKRLQLRKGLEWKRLESTYDTVHSQRPNAEMLFTVLYGIFPCNVVRFLRAPIDYLRKAEYQSPFQTDWEDIIDENAVQQKSAPIMRRHLLHPALADMDAEREISDTQRWNEHDTASTTAFCASLCLGNGETPAIDMSAVSLHDIRNKSLQVRNFSSLSNYPDSVSNASDGVYHPRTSRLLSNEFDELEQTPLLRFRRQRSASENLGRPGRNAIQASLFKTTFATRRRDPSVHFGPLQSLTSSASISPRLPSTWERRKQDEYLRNHVALRSDIPIPGSRSGSTSDLPVRSTSVRSPSGAGAVLRSFQPAQSTLASALMSPSRSSGLGNPIRTASEYSSTSNEGSTRDRSESLSSVASPVDVGEQLVLGSPALSTGGSNGGTTKRTKLAYLQQENLQLRNELNYEIGQKDQLLRYIGTIHRNRVKDTVLEEELQNLYQSARSDKIQLKSLKDEVEVIKAEARQSKNRQANWQADLTAKLKAIREEKKAWGNEIRHLKIVKEDRENLIEKLERQVEENASELFELREQVKADAKKVQAIHRYEDKITRLETSLRFWNDDMQVFEQQNEDMRRLLSRWEEMNMLMEASDHETDAMRKRMEAVELDNEILQRKVDEASTVINNLTKKQHSKAMERLNGSLSLKNKMEDMQASREDQRIDLQEDTSDFSNFAAEHEIAPFSLGEAVSKDVQ